jgi:hypothetical protein
MHKANDVALYRAPGGNPASITARGILCDWPRRRGCAQMPTRVKELIPPPLRGGAPYFTPPPLRGGGWEGGDLSSAIQSDTDKGLAALSPPPQPSPLKGEGVNDPSSPLKGEGKTEPSSPLKGEGKQRHPPSSKETGHEQWLPISWIPDVRRSLHG